MEKFKGIMAEVLEVDSIEMTDELTAFDSWDSLTILSIIAVVSDEYQVELTREEIENSLTISGLKELIEIKQEFKPSLKE
jgi:acyl carrier protein